MKDKVTGLVFMVIALTFGSVALNYNVGTIDNPGPGFFPLVIGSMLFVTGVVTLISGYLLSSEPIDFKLKNISAITLSLLGFTVATQYINMIAGIIVLVTISSLAASTHSITRNIKIIAGLVAVAFAFKYLLGLNLPLL